MSILNALEKIGTDLEQDFETVKLQMTDDFNALMAEVTAAWKGGDCPCPCPCPDPVQKMRAGAGGQAHKAVAADVRAFVAEHRQKMGVAPNVAIDLSKIDWSKFGQILKAIFAILFPTL